MSNKPLVSVVMPVRNGEAFIRKAIESILSQTYRNLEFIIIDDGSTDRTNQIIKQFNDSRIQLIEFETPKGIVDGLNIGLRKAKGDFIARMDADDISLPNRIEKQVAYMQHNPDVGVLGTQYKAINGRTRKLPLTHNEIKWHLLNASPFVHPSVMFRTQVVREHELYYDKAFEYAEDLELWVRAARVTQLSNLPEALIKYRFHQGTHKQNIIKVGELNTQVKIPHAQWLLPNCSELEVNILATTLNRHISHPYSKEWFFDVLKFLNQILHKHPEELLLSPIFKQAIWFHATASPKEFLKAKTEIKKTSWIDFSMKEWCWIQIKQLL